MTWIRNSCMKFFRCSSMVFFFFWNSSWDFPKKTTIDIGSEMSSYSYVKNPFENSTGISRKFLQKFFLRSLWKFTKHSSRNFRKSSTYFFLKIFQEKTKVALVIRFFLNLLSNFDFIKHFSMNFILNFSKIYFKGLLEKNSPLIFFSRNSQSIFFTDSFQKYVVRIFSLEIGFEIPTWISLENPSNMSLKFFQGDFFQYVLNRVKVRNYFKDFYRNFCNHFISKSSVEDLRFSPEAFSKQKQIWIFFQ